VIWSFQSESIKVISQGNTINEPRQPRHHKNTKNTDCSDRQRNRFLEPEWKTPDGFVCWVLGC